MPSYMASILMILQIMRTFFLSIRLTDLVREIFQYSFEMGVPWNSDRNVDRRAHYRPVNRGTFCVHVPPRAFMVGSTEYMFRQIFAIIMWARMTRQNPPTLPRGLKSTAARRLPV